MQFYHICVRGNNDNILHFWSSDRFESSYAPNTYMIPAFTKIYMSIKNTNLLILDYTLKDYMSTHNRLIKLNIISQELKTPDLCWRFGTSHFLVLEDKYLYDFSKKRKTLYKVTTFTSGVQMVLSDARSLVVVTPNKKIGTLLLNDNSKNKPYPRPIDMADWYLGWLSFFDINGNEIKGFIELSVAHALLYNKHTFVCTKVQECIHAWHIIHDPEWHTRSFELAQYKEEPLSRQSTQERIRFTRETLISSVVYSGELKVIGCIMISPENNNLYFYHYATQKRVQLCSVVIGPDNRTVEAINGLLSLSREDAVVAV